MLTLKTDLKHSKELIRIISITAILMCVVGFSLLWLILPLFNIPLSLLISLVVLYAFLFFITFIKDFSIRKLELLLIASNVLSTLAFAYFLYLNDSHYVFVYAYLVPYFFSNIIYHNYINHVFVSLLTVFLGVIISYFSNNGVDYRIVGFFYTIVAITTNVNVFKKVKVSSMLKFHEAIVRDSDLFILILNENKELIYSNESIENHWNKECKNSIIKQLIQSKKGQKVIFTAYLIEQENVVVRWSKSYQENGSFVYSGMDVTKESSQKNELENLSIVAQKTSNGVAILDEFYNVIWINSPLEKITGYSIDEFIGKKPSDVIEIRKDYIEKVNSTRLEGLGYSLKLPFYNKDKILKYILIDSTPIFDELGKFIKQVEIIKDITKEEEVSQENFRISHQIKVGQLLNQILLRESSEVGKIKDALEVLSDLKKEYVSVSFFEINEIEKDFEFHEYSKLTGEFSSGKINDFKKRESYKKLRKNKYFLISDIENIDVSFPVKERLIDQGVKCFIMYPIFFDGKLKGAINVRASKADSITSNDIIPLQEFANSFAFFMKEKESQRLISESETNFRQMADSMTEVFWLFDLKEKKNLYISNSVSHLFEFPYKKFVKNDGFWESCVHADDQSYYKAGLEILKIDGQFEETYRIITGKNKIKWIEEKTFPVRDESNEIIRVSGIAKDVTFKFEAEKELKGLANRLEIINKLNNCILSNESIEPVIKDVFNKTVGFENIINTSILTFNYEKGVAEFFFTYGVSDEVVFEKSVDLKDLNSIDLLQSEKYLIVKNLESEENISAYDERLKILGVNAYIVIGIKKDKELIGSFNISFANGDLITDELIEICSEISSGIGLSIYEKNIEEALQLEKQHLFELNKDVTDSIKYATRIQNAHLPKENLLNKFGIKTNLYYAPKDIVSGDFYWWTKVGDKLIITVSDCTGHGVPGALMTILGLNNLSMIVEQMQTVDPGSILTHLNSAIHNSLMTEDHNSIDGMDMSIIVYDLEVKKLEYACAKRPIVHISKGNVSYYFGNKASLGEESNTIYTTKLIDLSETDKLLMYSDGFVDQFGEKINKKYGTRQLKGVIEKNRKSSFDVLSNEILNSYIAWKGEEDQIDDVTFLSLEF
jgi:PAS domain S-box-containing protein